MLTYALRRRDVIRRRDVVEVMRMMLPVRRRRDVSGSVREAVRVLCVVVQL